MLDEDQDGSTGVEAPSPGPLPDDDAPQTYDETIIEELGALIDDVGLYATAEIAFQKTRAKLAGKAVGLAAAFIILAIILLHISLIALAVGFVIALEPLVSIWGAIAIVVGVMLVLVGILGYLAVRKIRLMAALFASAEKKSEEAP